MSRRILLGCYEIPGWGGASTSCYALFERLQRDGHDVAFVNLIAPADDVFFRYVFGESYGNPRGLADVHNCILDEPRSSSALGALIRSLRPDLLLGFGFLAAGLLRAAAPAVPLVFMTAGCRNLQRLIVSGAVRDFIGFRRAARRGVRFPVPADDREHRALVESDLTVVHSPLVRFAFQHFFGADAQRMYARDVSVADVLYAEAERFAERSRPFAARDIDVLFVASSWQRPEKNRPLMEKIAARCRPLAVHVVGELDRPPRGIQAHGVVTGRNELYALLGRAKAVVSPSLVDAAPGILFEASAMGCNVVASPNCGNWSLCHEDLAAERCAAGDLVDRIRIAVTRPYPDHRQAFRGGYDDLVETLSAI